MVGCRYDRHLEWVTEVNLGGHWRANEFGPEGTCECAQVVSSTETTSDFFIKVALIVSKDGLACLGSLQKFIVPVLGNAPGLFKAALSSDL